MTRCCRIAWFRAATWIAHLLPLRRSHVPHWLPWQVRAAYRRRTQCPAYQEPGGGFCCVRDRHEDPWHRDVRGSQWLSDCGMA